VEYIIRRKKPKMFTSIFGFFTLNKGITISLITKPPKLKSFGGFY